MAEKKKRSEVLEDEVELAETQEVEVSAPEVDMPSDAPQSGTTTVGTIEEPIIDTDNVTDDVADDEAKTTKAGKRSAKALREASEEAERLAAKDTRAMSEEEVIHAPRRQDPNPLHQHGKKFRDAQEKIDRNKVYSLSEALELAKATSTTKFDASIELHVNLGVDPRQADQMVRASVTLPHGTGKTLRVAVFADGAAAEAATKAGADLVGTDTLLAAIEAGKLDFDILIATPDKMATLGRVARVLGPRGLMPNPKSGTVTPNPAAAVTDAKGGKVEFRIDKTAIVHQIIGKVSFESSALTANAEVVLSAILRAKPSAAKGTYVKAISVASSMGPGVKVDAPTTTASIATSR